MHHIWYASIPMDIVAQIRRAFHGRPHAELRAFAKKHGINYYTFRKVVSGETANPRYRLIEKVRPHIPAPRRARRAPV